MRAGEIAAILARDAESVAEYLLPRGTRKGRHWVAGSTAGEEGESLKVLICGPKAGQWSDFATDEGGDLLDLWQACRSVSLPDAMREACDYAGIAPTTLRPPRREYTRPARPKGQAAKSAGRAYLKSRGISDAAIDAYRVAENGRELIFPSLRDGELIAIKYRSIASKAFRQEAGQEPCLFGWQAVPDDARAVVICEGELDALSWATWGIPALSVPMGGGTGGKQSWIENEFDRLARFDRIYLSFDADEPGQSAMRDVAARLGRERCYVIALPKKDANDCLMSGFTSDDAAAAIESARTMDPEQLREAVEFKSDILRELFDSRDDGLETPWSYLDGQLRFRPGELVVLAGATGHGKSQVMGQLTACAMYQGARCLVASMEFKPARWLRNLTEQVGGMREGSITREYAADIVDWFDGRLWVFDVTGTATAQDLIDVFTYARSRYDVTWFVIDNLSKCGIPDDDYAAQKRFVDQMSDFARDHGVTLFIVHHMRKGMGNGEQGRSDIKGSGGITDMAHTVCTIWRNRDKEDGEENEQEKPDAVFRVTKQRETGKEPAVGLWYYPASGQFCQKGQGPRAYIPPRAKPGGNAEGGGFCG